MFVNVIIEICKRVELHLSGNCAILYDTYVGYYENYMSNFNLVDFLNILEIIRDAYFSNVQWTVLEILLKSSRNLMLNVKKKIVFNNLTLY